MARRTSYLFQSNPPTEPGLLTELLVNRERELRRALEQLREPSQPSIAAIHGERRVGKSHFARVLLAKVREEALSYQVVQINANNRGSARAVLEELFFEVRKALIDLSPDLIDGRDGELGHHRWYGPEMDRVEVFAALLAGTLSQVNLEVSEVVSSSGKFQADFAPAAKVVVSLEEGRQAGAKETRTLQAPLPDLTLIEQLRVMLTLLHEVSGRRLLMLVDDLDLVERDGDEGGDVAYELAGHLLQFAGEPAVVLATVRQATFTGRNKDFSDFLRIRPLPDSDLREIVRCHERVLNGGDLVFSDDALALLVRAARGRIGVLLQRAREVWQEEDPLVDPAALYAWAQRRFRDSNAPAQALAAVRDAVRNGSDEVRDLDERLVKNNELYLRVLHPLPGVPNGWKVDEIFAGALRAEP